MQYRYSPIVSQLCSLFYSSSLSLEATAFEFGRVPYVVTHNSGPRQFGTHAHFRFLRVSERLDGASSEAGAQGQAASHYYLFSWHVSE